MSSHKLENSQQWITNVHRQNDCWGDRCPVHKRSDHHMRSWPQIWRQDISIIERLCPHGVGHPDPDEPNKHLDDHICDGCCAPPPIGST